ncbi:MAG: hypothetical protein A3K60_00340 [Euryarchaeota archaeon RBG_19FT_COMBO_56_21]|nr:MAG: hypothetical protein A3K60_00340 [Euryarchaeota archaeon RBG_19FT_COMBO_56_21]
MGRISRGWQLAKMSLRIIRKDKEILLFPLLSGIITLLILGSFFGGMFAFYGLEGITDDANSIVFYVFFGVFYFVSFFVTTFFNACVIGAATIRMNGGNPTFSDGIKAATGSLKQIIVWSLFAATVGLILRAIQERVGFLGKIIVGALGLAFTVATYFVVPVLVFEKLGPWGALKRSVSILKGAWGEALIGNLGLGIIFFLFGLLGLIPIIAGIWMMTFWSIVVGVVVAIVYWLILGLIASAATSVLVAALYRYATTGKTAEEFGDLSFSNPWAAPTYR